MKRKLKTAFIMTLLASCTGLASCAVTSSAQQTKDNIPEPRLTENTESTPFSFAFEPMSNLQDLVVVSGDTKILPARTRRFNNIYIEQGATVVIPQGSSRWSIWWADGDVRIDGKVMGQGFARKSGSISARTPDGKSVSYEFSRAAVGGDGTNGGSSRQGGRSSAGGLGASGTAEYGGGGGSSGGVRIALHESRIGSAGQNGRQWRGGPPAVQHGRGSGGNGGKADRHSNGALLLIRSGKTLSGQGKFNFQGDKGVNGKEGVKSSRSNRGFRGHSGGGGGAPGGDGGYIILIAASLNHDFELRLDPGMGGAGGKVGSQQSGSEGDRGDYGSIDEFTLEDWLARP